MGCFSYYGYVSIIQKYENFNESLDYWNVSNVTNMESMFSGCMYNISIIYNSSISSSSLIFKDGFPLFDTFFFSL